MFESIASIILFSYVVLVFLAYCVIGLLQTLTYIAFFLWVCWKLLQATWRMVTWPYRYFRRDDLDLGDYEES